MKTLIDEARGLADNERLTDADLSKFAGERSKAAELALEMRRAERAPHAGDEADASAARHTKALTPRRIANLKREAGNLAKHAGRCVIAAVDCERRGQIADALATFDAQARAERRIAHLMAIPAVWS